MLNAYLSWVDSLEAHCKAFNEMADEAHGQSLRTGLAINEVLLRLWWPWTF